MLRGSKKQRARVPSVKIFENVYQPKDLDLAPGKRSELVREPSVSAVEALWHLASAVKCCF